MSRLKRVKVKNNGHISGSDLGDDVVLQGNGEGDLQGYGYIDNDTAVEAKAGKTLEVGSPEWKARAYKTAEAIKNGEFDLKNVSDPQMYNYIQGIIGPGGENDVTEGINKGSKVALGALSVPFGIIGGTELVSAAPAIGGALKRVIPAVGRFLANKGLEIGGGLVGGTVGDKAGNKLAQSAGYEGWGDMASSIDKRWNNAYHNNGWVKFGTDMTNPLTWVGGSVGTKIGKGAQLMAEDQIALARAGIAKLQGTATPEQQALLQSQYNLGVTPNNIPITSNNIPITSNNIPIDSSIKIGEEGLNPSKASEQIKAAMQEKAFRKGEVADLTKIPSATEAIAPGEEGTLHLPSRASIQQDMPKGTAVNDLSKSVHDAIFADRTSPEYIVGEADRLLSNGEGLKTNAPILWQAYQNGDETAAKVVENIKKVADGKLVIPPEGTGRLLPKENALEDISKNYFDGSQLIYPVLNKDGYAISPLQGIEAATKFERIYPNGNRFVPHVTSGLKGVENGSVLDLSINGGTRSASYNPLEQWSSQYMANDAPTAAFYGRDGMPGDIKNFKEYLKSLGWSNSAIEEAVNQKEIIRGLMEEANWGYKPRVDAPIIFDKAKPDRVFTKAVMPSRLMFPGDLKTGTISPDLFQKRLDFDRAVTRLGGMAKQYNTKGVVEMYAKTPQSPIPTLKYNGDWWREKELDGLVRRYDFQNLPENWKNRLWKENKLKDFTKGSLYDYPTFIKNGGNKGFKFFENGDQFAHYVEPNEMAIIRDIRDVPYGAPINDFIVGTNLVNLKSGGILKRVSKKKEK